MILVTKAKPEDVRSIQELLYETWLETYPNSEAGITEEDIHTRFKERMTDKVIKERQEKLRDNSSRNELFLVAKENDELVGVCGVSAREEYNELQAIYVSPKHQRKGIGYMMWDEAKKYFNPEKKTIVHVADYNEKAISFYKKLGFVDTGKRFSQEIHKMPVSGKCIPEMEMVIEV